MYCSHCGAKNSDNANFCSSCGREISPKASEPPSQVHHPWMTAQEPPEQPQPQEQQEQDKGETPNLIRRIQGWSRRKKIVWGLIVGFLFLTCVSAVIAEPVENENPDEGNTSEPLAKSPEQGLGVSFNDIRADFVDRWDFSFNRMIVVHDETAVSVGTIKGNKFPATLRIEESKGEITKFEAQINAAEGSEKLNAEDNVILSVGMLAAFVQLVLPEWGEDGATWILESGGKLDDGDSVETSFENAQITYGLKSGVLILTIQAGAGETSEAGDETAKVQSPESTATPELPEEDRIAGTHCMSELKAFAGSMLQLGMQQPVSLKWAGYDTSSLKMGDYEIYPLGSEMHSVFVKRERYGDPWRDKEEHVARAEFSVKTVAGRRVNHTAAFWVRNDDCKIALIDFD